MVNLRAKIYGNFTKEISNVNSDTRCYDEKKNKASYL